MTDQLFQPAAGEETVRRPVAPKSAGQTSDDELASALFSEPTGGDTDTAGAKDTAESSGSLFPQDPFLSGGEPPVMPAEIIDLPTEPLVEEAEEPPVTENADDSFEQAVFGTGFVPAPSAPPTEEPATEAQSVSDRFLFDDPEEIIPTSFFSSEKTDEIPEDPVPVLTDATADIPATPEKPMGVKSVLPFAPPMTEEMIRIRRREEKTAALSAKVRFCIGVLLTMMLAVLELFPAFGPDVTVALEISRIRGASALLDLQFLLLIAFCAGRSVVSGFRSFFGPCFREEGVLSVSLLLLTAYDLYFYFTAAVTPVLCALPLAVALVASVYLEMDERQNRRGILSLLSGRTCKNAAVYRNGTLTVAPARHIDGYDRMVNTTCESGKFQFLLLVLSLLSGAGAALVAFAGDGGTGVILASGMSAFLLSVPFAALFSRRMYFSALQKAMLSAHTAVVGERTIRNVAGTTVLSFADTEAFSATQTKIRVVNVFHDSRLDETLNLVSGVFRSVGGPLYPVLARTGGEAGVDGSVELTGVPDGGLTAISGGRSVLIGSAAFMEKNSIPLDCDTADSTHQGDRMCVMYCAVNGMLTAKFCLEYALDASFEAQTEQLLKSDVRVELRTLDPNLTDSYLRRISCIREEALSLCRMPMPEGEVAEERAETGLFTMQKPRHLLSVLLVFRKYVRRKRALSVLKIAQTFLGAALWGALAFFASETLVPVYAVGVYSVLTVLLVFRMAAGFGAKCISRNGDPTTKESKL